MRRIDWSNVVIASSVVVGISAGILDGHLHHWLRDGLRWLELVMTTAIVVISLGIARRYWLNYDADPTKARLLPRHVVRLGLGVVGFSVASSAWVISLIGDEFAWQATPLLLPTLTILLSGLIDMLLWLPNRTAPPTNHQRRETDPFHNGERE